MSVILYRILNIIITSWQRKDPICHWKICPQMKQMIAVKAWFKPRPAIWLPRSSNLVRVRFPPQSLPFIALPTPIPSFLHLISSNNPPFCILIVWQLHLKGSQRELSKVQPNPLYVKKEISSYLRAVCVPERKGFGDRAPLAVYGLLPDSTPYILNPAI